MMFFHVLPRSSTCFHVLPRAYINFHVLPRCLLLMRRRGVFGCLCAAPLLLAMQGARSAGACTPNPNPNPNADPIRRRLALCLSSCAGALACCCLPSSKASTLGCASSCSRRARVSGRDANRARLFSGPRVRAFDASTRTCIFGMVLTSTSSPRPYNRPSPARLTLTRTPPLPHLHQHALSPLLPKLPPRTIIVLAGVVIVGVSLVSW